jgi:Protein of unknown function (DUF3662)/FHA domain
VGVLDRFEKRLDRLVNGAFARTFKAEVEPVEVAAALQRECDDRAAIVDRNRRVVPNVFTVELGARDFERLSPYAVPLGSEFAAMVRDHAEEAGYVFFGPVQIGLEEADDLDTGLFRIRSGVHAAATPKTPAAPQPPAGPASVQVRPTPEPAVQWPVAPLPPISPDSPVSTAGPVSTGGPVAPAGTAGGAVAALELDGRRFALEHASTTIGRAPECDISIDDPGISRTHARIDLNGPPVVVDLGSTNGTWVDGRRVQKAELRDGASLAVGSTTFVVRLGG